MHQRHASALQARVFARLRASRQHCGVGSARPAAPTTPAGSSTATYSEQPLHAAARCARSRRAKGTLTVRPRRIQRARLQFTSSSSPPPPATCPAARAESMRPRASSESSVACARAPRPRRTRTHRRSDKRTRICLPPLQQQRECVQRPARGLQPPEIVTVQCGHTRTCAVGRPILHLRQMNRLRVRSCAGLRRIASRGERAARVVRPPQHVAVRRQREGSAATPGAAGAPDLV